MIEAIYSLVWTHTSSYYLPVALDSVEVISLIVRI